MKRFLAGAILSLATAALSMAQPVIGQTVEVTVTPGFTDGDHTGRLTLDGTYDYWWFCVQPDGSQGPDAAGPFQATLAPVEYGWSHQYIGRSTESGTQGLAKQATIIGYLLDTYLPWDQAGPSGRFLEQAANAETTAGDFYEALDAIYYYVMAMQPFSVAGTGLERTDFTTFNPVNPFDNATATGADRQTLFNTIVSDIIAQDAAGLFSTYSVLGQYAIVNTEENHQSGGNPGGTLVAQDVLVIMGAPVPEPSAVMLALGSTLALGFRRRRPAA